MLPSSITLLCFLYLPLSPSWSQVFKDEGRGEGPEGVTDLGFTPQRDNHVWRENQVVETQEFLQGFLYLIQTFIPSSILHMGGIAEDGGK